MKIIAIIAPTDVDTEIIMMFFVLLDIPIEITVVLLDVSLEISVLF